MSLALNNKVVTSGPTFTSLNEFVRHLGSDDVHAAAYGVGCQLNLSAPTHPLTPTCTAPTVHQPRLASAISQESLYTEADPITQTNRKCTTIWPNERVNAEQRQWVNRTTKPKPVSLTLHHGAGCRPPHRSCLIRCAISKMMRLAIVMTVEAVVQSNQKHCMQQPSVRTTKATTTLTTLLRETCHQNTRRGSTRKHCQCTRRGQVATRLCRRLGQLRLIT